MRTENIKAQPISFITAGLWTISEKRKKYEGHEEDFATAYKNGTIVNGIDIRYAVNTYSKVSASIDLDDYKESEIERCINTFGYTIRGGRDFIDLNREEFKEVFPKQK